MKKQDIVTNGRYSNGKGGIRRVLRIVDPTFVPDYFKPPFPKPDWVEYCNEINNSVSYMTMDGFALWAKALCG